MRRTATRFGSFPGLASGRRTAVAAMLLVACAVAANAYSQPRTDRRLQDRIDEARRLEGQALLSLADGAMSGHVSSDFAIQWTNDFFKAEAGTFVPFTLTMEGAELTAAKALLYVRAVRRDAALPR